MENDMLSSLLRDPAALQSAVQAVSGLLGGAPADGDDPAAAQSSRYTASGLPGGLPGDGDDRPARSGLPGGVSERAQGAAEVEAGDPGLVDGPRGLEAERPLGDRRRVVAERGPLGLACHRVQGEGLDAAGVDVETDGCDIMGHGPSSVVCGARPRLRDTTIVARPTDLRQEEGLNVQLISSVGGSGGSLRASHLIGPHLPREARHTSGFMR